MKADTVVEFDVALIERARRGDAKAFERLYRDHVGRVHGLCLRMTRHPDLAADVQDVSDRVLGAAALLGCAPGAGRSAPSEAATRSFMAQVCRLP